MIEDTQIDDAAFAREKAKWDKRRELGTINCDTYKLARSHFAPTKTFLHLLGLPQTLPLDSSHIKTKLRGNVLYIIVADGTEFRREMTEKQFTALLGLPKNVTIDDGNLDFYKDEKESGIMFPYEARLPAKLLDPLIEAQGM